MKNYFITLLTRCRDEPFLIEFVDHYFNEGVDFIYLIDDNVNTHISSEILNNKNISILKTKKWTNENTLQMADLNILFRDIHMLSEWFIFVDCDEFITSKQNYNNTIKTELLTTFKDFDCIKVPWAFMSCEQRNKDPEHLLEELIYRWDHDIKHPHPGDSNKFRCRYDEIEVKCIFKGSKVDVLSPHHPIPFEPSNYKVVNSINAKPCLLNSFYKNLRNKDIDDAYLICYHYRIMSQESALRKAKYYTKFGGDGYHNYDVDSIMLADHAEIRDETLKSKSIQRKSLMHNTSRKSQ